MKQIVIGVNPEYDAMREKVAQLERAFDDQTRELENALSFLTPKQLSEFRQRTYPRLHGKVGTNPIERMLNEASAELSHTRRWSYWAPVIDAAWDEYGRLVEMLHAAIDDDWENPELVSYRTARSGWQPK